LLKHVNTLTANEQLILAEVFILHQKDFVVVLAVDMTACRLDEMDAAGLFCEPTLRQTQLKNDDVTPTQKLHGKGS